jgi:hypothetical protein
MDLPLINLPVRVLIRTRLAQLQTINPSFNKADIELIKRLCNRLSITGKTKIRYLITRISDSKKVDSNSKVDNKKVNNKKVDSEKVDGNKVNNKVDSNKVDSNKVNGNKVNSNKVDNNRVDSEELERVNIIFDYSLPIIQSRVIVYSITVKGSDLTIK